MTGQGSLPGDRNMRLGRIYDLSHTIIPGQEEYRLELDTRPVDQWEQFAQYPRIGDSWYVISEVTMNTHTGTHVELPFHHVRDGLDAATFPLEKLVGEGTVVDISTWGHDEAVTCPALQRLALGRVKPGDIVYFHTGCDRHYRTSRQHERPFFMPDAIEWLVHSLQIKALGIDAYGIEPRSADGSPYPGQPNHETLLQAGVPLVEYMANLAPLVSRRFYTFILPVKIAGAEAFPVRVIAVVLEE